MVDDCYERIQDTLFRNQSLQEAQSCSYRTLRCTNWVKRILSVVEAINRDSVSCEFHRGHRKIP